jgi:hypothetical protein
LSHLRIEPGEGGAEEVREERVRGEGRDLEAFDALLDDLPGEGKRKR